MGQCSSVVEQLTRNEQAVGSIPTSGSMHFQRINCAGTVFTGRLSQLVRELGLHPRCRRFESASAHHNYPPATQWVAGFFIGRRHPISLCDFLPCFPACSNCQSTPKGEQSVSALNTRKQSQNEAVIASLLPCNGFGEGISLQFCDLLVESGCLLSESWLRFFCFPDMGVYFRNDGFIPCDMQEGMELADEFHNTVLVEEFDNRRA